MIDDTQSRNFKEAAKYLPLVSFQEMQGPPEVLRPETRGMQGSNMQNDLKEWNGNRGHHAFRPRRIRTSRGSSTDWVASYTGPANPSGMFNFVTKRPTEEPFGEVELDYEGSTVATAHIDLGGRLVVRKEIRIPDEFVVGRRAKAMSITASSVVSWARSTAADYRIWSIP